MSKFRQLSLELLPLIDVKSLFPLSTLSIFLQIFFKLCIRVDIRKNWFGIVDGLIASIKSKVMALDLRYSLHLY